MAEIAVDLVLVPVAALPLDGGDVDLVAYRPGGRWISGTLQEDLDRVATELTLAEGPPLLREVDEWCPQVDPITFVEREGSVSLLYSVGVPMTSPLLDATLEAHSPGILSEDWVRIASASAGFRQPLDDPIISPVLLHWRQMLEETTAAFELLPKYFTTPQARALYEAVWGEQQDAGNFHKWLHGQDPPVCKPASVSSIGREIEAVGHEKWGSTPALAGVSLRAAAPNLVGISPAVLLGGALGSVVGANAVGAVAGGLVAYQAARRPGKQPEWYTRASDRRENLSDLYAPRPTWTVTLHSFSAAFRETLMS